MILLSIIVPIFNTKVDLLQRCLFSLENIEIDEYEVLLIDDGSDAYIEKSCSIFIQTNRRFKYLKKINGGVSSARNYGIDNALGSYIMFVDSDDEIVIDSITKKDFSSHADLIIFNETFYKDKKQKIRKEIDGKSREISVNDVVEAMLLFNRFHGPVAKLYKTSVLREIGIHFDVDMMQGEDAVFNIEFLKQSKTIYYIDKSVYNYHMQPTTLRRRWRKNPQKMLSNFQCLYARKLKLTDMCNDIVIKETLCYGLNSNMEYLLFQSCLDMIRVRVFNKDLQEACYRLSKSISSNGKLNVKAKTASLFMEHRLWRLMGLIGGIRELYLSKIKRTWD